MAAVTPLLPGAASAFRSSDAMEGSSMGQTAGSSNGHYTPPFKFGMGGVPLGNEFEVVTEEEAYATIEAAWNAGVRYYDMAPWYGLGLAERRYGNFLHTKTRSEYVLSTKVGEASQCVGDGGHVVASNNVADDGCNVAGKSIAASFHPIFITG
jgi:D-threo-aldose 1-dehydrogenase